MNKKGLTKIIVTMSLILVISGFLVASVQPAKAQEEELKNPGITPDHPLYGIDRAMEQIQMSVTEDESNRAQLGLQFAEERISEGIEMGYRGEPEFVQQVTEQYRQQLNESLNISDNLPEDQRERIQEMIANKTTKHLDHMEQVREKVPAQARQGIQEALNHTKMGRGMALGHLSEVAPQKSGQMHYQYAQNLAYELQRQALDLEIEAEVVENGTNVYLEINDSEQDFFLNTTDKQTVVTQIAEGTNLSIEEVNEYIEFKGEEELEIEAEITSNKTLISIREGEEEQNLETQFVDRDEVVAYIAENTELSEPTIYRNLELDDERDIEISWTKGENQSHIELKIEDETLNYTINTTDTTEIIESIQERTDLSTTTIREEIREAIMTRERAQEYAHEYNLSTELMERAREMGINISMLEERLANSTSRHLGALIHVYNKAPEPAKNSLIHAMNQSMKGQTMAMDNIRQRNPQAAESIEKGMPSWVKEMRNNWMNDSFRPGMGGPGAPGRNDTQMPGPNMPHMPGQGDRDHGPMMPRDSRNSERGPGMQQNEMGPNRDESTTQGPDNSMEPTNKQEKETNNPTNKEDQGNQQNPGIKQGIEEETPMNLLNTLNNLVGQLL